MQGNFAEKFADSGAPRPPRVTYASRRTRSDQLLQGVTYALQSGLLIIADQFRPSRRQGVTLARLPNHRRPVDDQPPSSSTGRQGVTYACAPTFNRLSNDQRAAMVRGNAIPGHANAMPFLDEIDRTIADDRAEARRLGLILYKGKRCRHGHEGIRYTSTRRCNECRGDESLIRSRKAKRETLKRVRRKRARDRLALAAKASPWAAIWAALLVSERNSPAPARRHVGKA
jgi:hypothetical protein